MKDFDFDELDRAVHSVLSKKQQPITSDDQSVVAVDSPTVAAPLSIVDDTPGPAVADEPSDEMNTPPVEEPSQDDTSLSDNDDVAPDEPELPEHNQPETADTAAPEPSPEIALPVAPEPDDTPRLKAPEPPVLLEDPSEPADAMAETESAPAADHPATIPQKRGRFMDMVHPSADMAQLHKPIPTRTSVMLQPSANFSMAEQPAEEASDSEPMPIVNEAVASDEVVAEPTMSDQTEEEPDTSPVPTEVEPETTAMPESTPALSEPVPEPPSTPFIPDVPVEKRPLNPQSTDTPPESDVPPVPAPSDATTVVVEAEPNTGESVAVAEANPAEVPSIAPQYQAPEEKTDQDHHPVFDSASIAQPLQAGHAVAAKAPSSHLMVIIIIAVLFLVGATIGVLYFLYGQGR